MIQKKFLVKFTCDLCGKVSEELEVDQGITAIPKGWYKFSTMKWIVSGKDIAEIFNPNFEYKKHLCSKTCRDKFFKNLIIQIRKELKEGLIE